MLFDKTAGKAVAEICREMGVSEQSFYHWRRKFAGMGVAELRRLRSLEDEWKAQAAAVDLSLDKHILQEALSKKV